MVPKGTKNIPSWSKTQPFLPLTFDIFPVTGSWFFFPSDLRCNICKQHSIAAGPKTKVTDILYQQKTLVGATLKVSLGVKEFLELSPK